MTSDLDRLQGSWAVASLEVDGQAVPASTLAAAGIAIDGNRFTSSGMGSVYEGTLALDASARPARIDMRFDRGPETGDTNPGIYRLEGDSWKLCLAHARCRTSEELRFKAGYRHCPRNAGSRKTAAEPIPGPQEIAQRWSLPPARPRSSKARGRCCPA